MTTLPPEPEPGDYPPWEEQIVPEPEEPEGHPTRAADVLALIEKEVG